MTLHIMAAFRGFFTIPRTVELASQTLPNAGAFTPVPAGNYSAIPSGTKYVAYNVSYTGKSATGYPKFRVELSNGTDGGGEMILDVASVTTTGASPGYATANVYVETLQNPSPPGNNVTWTGVVQIQVPANYTGIRLRVAEAGDTANPGTIATAFTGSGGGGA